jgi:hypothetical protein
MLFSINPKRFKFYRFSNNVNDKLKCNNTIKNIYRLKSVYIVCYILLKSIKNYFLLLVLLFDFVVSFAATLAFLAG